MEACGRPTTIVTPCMMGSEDDNVDGGIDGSTLSSCFPPQHTDGTGIDGKGGPAGGDIDS